MEIKITKKFSLVELITVVALAGIILTLTVPAFLTMTKGQAVSIATREIGSKLKAVRTYAITHRTRCALVFITNQELKNPEQNYGFKAYRACTVDSNNVFTQWVDDEKWEFFPMGAVLFAIITTATKNKTFATGEYDPELEAEVTQDIDFPNTTPEEQDEHNLNKIINTSLGSPIQLTGIVFKPTGEIPESSPYIYIGEGQRISENTIKIFNDKNISTININQYTGRVSYTNSE